MKDWATAHWFLTFIIVMSLVTGVRNLVARLIRMLMVTARGWPPAHLDADGDWKPEEKENDNAPV